MAQSQGIITNTQPDDARCVALYSAIVAAFANLTFRAATVYLDAQGYPTVRVTY